MRSFGVRPMQAIQCPHTNEDLGKGTLGVTCTKLVKALGSTGRTALPAGLPSRRSRYWILRAMIIRYAEIVNTCNGDSLSMTRTQGGVPGAYTVSDYWTEARNLPLPLISN